MNVEKLLQQASRLRALLAIGKARSRAAHTNSDQPQQGIRTMTDPTNFDNLEPTPEVKAIAAELLDRLTLNSDGQPFDDDEPSQWAAADAAEPEVVTLGAVRFKAIDADATGLALALGAVEPGGPALCLLVQFAEGEGAPQPSMGQYLRVATEEPGVSLLFRVWIAHSDLHDPAAPDLGPEAVRTEGLEAIADYPGRALLVQVFSDEEDGYEH